MSANSDFSLTRTDIAKLCDKGGKAPSGGNNQPWRVTIKQKRIMELALDVKRSESLLDIGRLASILALGAFLENVIITARSLGYSFNINYLEFNNVNDPVVRITFTGQNPEAEEHPLYSEIDKRITNRKIHDGKPISDEIIAALTGVTTKEDAKFEMSALNSEKEKKEFAEILGKADSIRTLHDGFFYQMMDEIRWTHQETESTKDGLDINTLELPPLFAKMLNLMKNYPSIRKTLPKRTIENQAKPLLVNSSHLCCLSMGAQPSPASMFEIGQVIQKLWLTATKKDLAFHPWTTLPFFIIRCRFFGGEGFTKEDQLQVKELDKHLRALCGIPNNMHPVLIFRLSKAGAPSVRSLRIPWEEYTEIQN